MAEGSDSNEWRSKCSTVVERWCEARRRNLFTDVDFLVGNSRKPFSAHKNVLAFSSPVFEAMFYGDLSEKKYPIVLMDDDPEAFDALLKHVYGSDVSFSSIAFAVKTYVLSDKYLISDLRIAAEKYISNAKMDDPQFWEVIQQDRFFHIPVINIKCVEYITNNAASLFKSYLLANVSFDVMEDILKMDKLKITEYELLSAIVRWGMGNFQCETKLKDKLGPFLSYIRFSNFTIDEFCNFDSCHPHLLDADDSLAILKHLNKKSEYKLPSWCCKSSKQRNT